MSEHKVAKFQQSRANEASGQSATPSSQLDAFASARDRAVLKRKVLKRSGRQNGDVHEIMNQSTSDIETSSDAATDGATDPAISPIAQAQQILPLPEPFLKQAAPMSGPNKGEIDVTPESMGQHMVRRMEESNKAPRDDENTAANVHYWYNAKHHIQKAGGAWTDRYLMGHHFASWTDPTSKFFKQPSDGNRFMTFELLPQKSASAAIKAWLQGPTIAECATAVLAMETDTVRAAIGDEKFDNHFGSTDAEKDRGIRDLDRQLTIATGSHAALATAVKSDWLDSAVLLATKDGDNLTPGDWCYFQNHPKYVYKHPGGAWRGENAVFMGHKQGTKERLWAGLGASTDTEQAMYEAMIKAYEADRTDFDYQLMVAKGILKKDANGTQEFHGENYRYTDAQYDPAAKSFPDKVTVDEIIAAGGGLRRDSRRILSVEQVKRLSK